MLAVRSEETLVYLSVIAVMVVAMLCAFDYLRRRMLIRLLGQIQFAAEERAGLHEDDDEPPKMRLVRD